MKSDVSGSNYKPVGSSAEMQLLPWSLLVCVLFGNCLLCMISKIIQADKKKKAKKIQFKTEFKMLELQNH